MFGSSKGANESSVMYPMVLLWRDAQAIISPLKEHSKSQSLRELSR